MRSKRGNLHIAIGLLGLLLLIFDSKTAISGATSGVSMCLQTIVPVLLPFIFLSLVITSRVTGRRYKIFQPLGKICGIPYGTEFLFLSGLIGGYPVGAQAIAKAWENGCIDSVTARRMLGFCSNAGPSFLFGVLGAVFTNKSLCWILWLIQILSAIIVAAMLPNRNQSVCSVEHAKPVGYSRALEMAVRTTGIICGWVILFKIIYGFMDHWVLGRFSTDMRVFIAGILELSGGCIQLSNCDSQAAAFLLASFLLSFGGLCVFMQTRTVTGRLGTGF